MKNTGAILAVLLTVFLCLSVSVVYAQEHTETSCRISNVDLNGQGIDLTVAPGGTFKLSFDYEVWSTNPLPISAQQLVIGLEREPLFCAYSGIPGEIPNSKKGHSQFTMTAPTKLGTYVIRWMTTFEPTCNYAKNAYRNSISLGYGMAEITVADKQGVCAKVSNVRLREQGNYMEVGADCAFSISLDYQTWSWTDKDMRQQIIIGLDDEPFWVVYDDISTAWSSSSGHGITYEKIQEPGTYDLMWITTFCNNKKDAMNFYKSHPELREKIGTIKVKDCSGGICDFHCEVTGVNLNGRDGYLEIGPGEIIRITIYYEIWSVDGCPECTHQLVIGLEDIPMYCAYDGTPGIHPGVRDHDDVFYEMVAPSKPGTYNLMSSHTVRLTCDRAKQYYSAVPRNRKKIGTIKVALDTTDPIVTIEEPAEGATSTNTVVVRWKGSDVGSGIDHYEISLDASTWENVGRRTTYTFYSVSDGNHEVAVRVYDRAGNWNYDVNTFLVPLGRTRFVTIQKPAISPTGKTLYFELHWDFLVIPYEEHTYPPFANAIMKIKAPEGTRLLMFEPIVSKSSWSQITTELSGVLLDVAGAAIDTIAPVSVSTIASLMDHAIRIQEAFQTAREFGRDGVILQETMGQAHFFTKIVYIVQIESDEPRDIWPIQINASAVHMVGPNVDGETLSQLETVTVTKTYGCW